MHTDEVGLVRSGSLLHGIDIEHHLDKPIGEIIHLLELRVRDLATSSALEGEVSHSYIYCAYNIYYTTTNLAIVNDRQRHGCCQAYSLFAWWAVGYRRPVVASDVNTVGPAVRS